MRRARNIGRGRGNGMDRHNVSSEPMLTEHIRDIDLELELLKRKREMIEQQHNVYQPFNKQSQFQSAYNQPTYTYNKNGGQSSSNRDLTYLYADGPQQNPKRFPKKRPADSNWQQDCYPKKSAVRGRGFATSPAGRGFSTLSVGRGDNYAGPSSVRNLRSFTSIKQTKINIPNKLRQGNIYIEQKTAIQRNQMAVKKFPLTKVTKPTKPLAHPVKIISRSVGESNNLITMKHMTKTEVLNQEEFRLLPDKEPTNQIRGRLEMGLGAILSDVRASYAESPHMSVLRTSAMQRIIKQLIRDRIRAVMLGKIVGPSKEVVKEYRDVFPKESDRDLVNETMKMTGYYTEKNLINSANKPTGNLEKPSDYFKDNIFKLLTNHLNEMFNKVGESYKKIPENASDILQIDFTDDNLEIKPTTASVDMKQDEDCKMDVDSTKTDGDVPKMDVDVPNIVQNVVKLDEDSANMAEDVDKTLANIVLNGEEAADKRNEIMNPHIYKKLLPRVIKTHIPNIIKLLNLNIMYKQAVADITATTRSKFVAYSHTNFKKESVPQYEIPVSTPVVQTTPKTTKSAYPLPYYVKLMGKPILPKRTLMQPFLDEFHPKSIKKHRSIPNLLFIGFTEKSDLEAIVAASGVLIGDSTISVKFCDNIKEKQENDSTVKEKDQQSQELSTRNEHNPELENLELIVLDNDNETSEAIDITATVKDNDANPETEKNAVEIIEISTAQLETEISECEKLQEVESRSNNTDIETCDIILLN